MQLAWRKFKGHRLALLGLGLLGTLLAVAIVGPVILPYDFATIPIPDQIVYEGRPPSAERIFGETGGLQRDVFRLVVNGARTSLFIGFSSMFIGVIIGTIVGSVAGYFGGFIDNLLMRIVDVMLSLPILFVILVASRFFGNGNVLLIVIIFGVFSWMGDRAPRAQPVPVDSRTGVRRGGASGRRAGSPDHLPAHPARTPSARSSCRHRSSWPATSSVRRS